MRKILISLALIGEICFVGSAVSVATAAEVSCECPQLGCDPCSYNKGVTFYTEKCGPRDSKLKSCGRPTCIPIDQASKDCPNPPKADSGPREPIVISQSGGQAKLANADDDRSAPKVGRIKVIKGSVSIVGADGNSNVVSGEGNVRETDTVSAAADAAALVNFDGGNKMHVHGGTEVKVKEFKDAKDSSARKVLLQLIKGKIRNQVEQKYNGRTSSFKIETKGAVAGVRGTDFVIEQKESDILETRVEALDGRVVFNGIGGKESREISRGEGATFTMPKPLANATDLSEFIEKGSLSPIYKIPDSRLKELEFESRVDVARAPKRKGGSAAETEICDKPKGFLNQCSWNMENGFCIRRRCNANGNWAEFTKLPSTGNSTCTPSGFTVKDCDY